MTLRERFQFDGNFGIDDSDEDAPLMRITLHNEFKKLTKDQKAKILIAILKELAVIWK